MDMDITGRHQLSEVRRLPEDTAPDRYLSGTVALNIASDEITGDWHAEMAFFRPRRTTPRCFLVGRGCENDTTPLLATRGVADRSDVLRRMGVPNVPEHLYAADHARAIADLVLVAVLRNQSPEFVGLDDWMPRPEDKRRVVDLLELAFNHLNESQRTAVLAWLSANRDS
ncbi:MAG TPA: hypothetical protein VGZ00_08135 [Candidatus Baltobacteraceae bacterium]|nr:hypothetical protein [Candidatus Baltobacteraceae bacterium]